MEGFTVYKCKTKDLNDVLHDSVFCAHPSYRTDSGQVSRVWYDWAIFNINGNDIPCQILLFLKITLKKLTMDGKIIPAKDNYVLVHIFDKEPKNYCDDYSSFVQYGQVSDCLQLINCDKIKSACAVVPNVVCDNNVRIT